MRLRYFDASRLLFSFFFSAAMPPPPASRRLDIMLIRADGENERAALMLMPTRDA